LWRYNTPAVEVAARDATAETNEKERIPAISRERTPDGLDYLGRSIGSFYFHLCE
jgi:hypothetical protein